MDTDDHQATEDPKTDMAETIPEKRNAAATDDGEAPVTKKKRAPAKPKKPTIDKEINGDAPDANVDEEAPMAKQKRTPTKSKKATNDKEVNGDATDANVDEEAPVAKQKRVLTKSKKVTTNNEDNGDVPNAKVNEEAPVAKGKRGAAKSKKPTTDNEDNGDATDPNLPITPPVTPPKKRGRKASTADDANVNASIPKPKASKKAKITESPGDSAEVTTSQESTSTTKTGTPRKRAPVTKDKAVARGLPTSMKECSEADRMLLHMKDVEGKPWADIRATWKAMTGQDTASSTLPNRYNRLKANLMELKEGDVSATIIPSFPFLTIFGSSPALPSLTFQSAAPPISLQTKPLVCLHYPNSIVAFAYKTIPSFKFHLFRPTALFLNHNLLIPTLPFLLTPLFTPHKLPSPLLPTSSNLSPRPPGPPPPLRYSQNRRRVRRVHRQVPRREMGQDPESDGSPGHHRQIPVSLPTEGAREAEIRRHRR